jgi:hypothetical protein
MGPPEAEGVDGAGGSVVVVVGGSVVVVVVPDVPPPEAPPPPLVAPLPDPPLPAPPPELPVAAVVTIGAVVVVVEVVVTVTQRFTRPENWLLLDSEARVRTASVRTAFWSRPPNADAEASMLTIATRAHEATPSVRIF